MTLPGEPPRAEEGEAHAPPLSLMLAYAALLPLCAGAGAAWWVAPPGRGLAVRLFVAWAGGLLCFFSGVRRGLSFRQAGGPTTAQLAATLWLFMAGIASLLSPWPAPALALQLLAYASIAGLDPLAARRGEAPVYFGRLRPVQMLIPVACAGLVLARII